MLFNGLSLAVHFHRFHGSSFDYLGLAVGACVSWIGGIGPGEALLIAAAVLASEHKLDLTEALVVAWGGANVGGVIGWLIGYRAGGLLASPRGPLHGARMRTLARGERIFERATVTAVVLTPSWLAGVHRVPALVYLPANAFSAALWALVIGVGGYFAGPPVADMFSDLGTVALVLFGAIVVLGGVAEVIRRHRKRG